MENSIAVVGMAGRLPSANNLEEFWDILSQGIDAVVPRPRNRPRMARNGEHMVKAAAVVPIEAGFLKCPLEEFDEKFFGVSPREAIFMDPQQRLLLEVAWESLENSGINPLNLKGSNASVFVGIWQNDYAEIIPWTLSQENMHHRYTGNAFSATTSKISYFLGLHGPNIAVESGCSSSLSAMHLACESLRHGETSLALCGGVNIILDEVAPLGYVLSKDQRCKTFNESADGFVRAEACGMVVLKRYADAVNDENKILAVVRGSAMNNDGAGSSFGTPNHAAQELVIRSALKNAGIKPSEVNLIEAHGTGTAVGDPTEVAVLGNVYSEGRKTDSPVWLSSVKSNMGHAEAAAGIAGFLKVLLCFKNKSIPPHLHLKKLNPNIQLDSIPAKIPQELTKWEGTGRIAALSSFSMSGTNVHVIIEETPEVFELPDPILTAPHVLTISAKSEAALEVYCSRYLEFAKKNPHANIQDISYGMNVEKALFPYRIALTATNMEEFGSKLEAREFQHGKLGQRKIAFLFPGQGCQYFGMGQDLYKTVPLYTSAWDKCNSKFESVLGLPLSDVVWGDPHYLQNTQYCQPAIFCLQVALTSMWNSFGIFPDVVLGHSVGEFAAAVASGILSFEDAFKLVVGRSELVSKLDDGAMLAVKADEVTTRKLIGDFENEYFGNYMDIAAINSSNEIVVSGNKNTISNFERFCKGRDQLVQQIQSSAAYHTRAMDSCLDDYGRIAETITLNKCEPKVTFISSTRAVEMSPEELGPEYWKDHLRKPVLFSAAVYTMSKHGCDVFLEIGPQPTLTALAMMQLASNKEDRVRRLFSPSMRKKEDNLKTLTMTLAKLFVGGAEINWKNWFMYKRRHVELPFYPFQRSTFWCDISGDSEGHPTGCSNLPLLHTLLGCRIKAPGHRKIFCKRINIKELSLAYLQDHKVGHKTILPGAAYLEIILSAAKQIGIGGQIRIENFSIEAPLNLEFGATLYTSVGKISAETGTYKIKIHRELETGDDSPWKLQAKGYLRSSEAIAEHGRDLDALKMQLKATDEAGVEEIYNIISNSGIQFGPEFKRIRQLWSREDELLAKIEVPTDITLDNICHPVVLDAMLQTFAFMKLASVAVYDKKYIHLPVGIQKVTWFPRKVTTDVYALASWHLRTGRDDKKDFSIALYNSAGETIGMMEGPEFIQTSLAAFLHHLNATKKTNFPQMWEAIWKPMTKYDRRAVDLLPLQMPSNSTPLVANLQREAELDRDKIMAGLNIDDIFIYVLLRAASELNWGLELGCNIKMSNIRNTFSHEIQNIRALEYWIGILVSKGYLYKIPNSSGEDFEVIRDIPDVAECKQNITRIFSKVTESCKTGDASIPFAKRVEEKFEDILRGKFQVFELLFPKDELEVGACRFYNECFAYQLNRNFAICAIFDYVNSNQNPGVFRILEVGGGTGAATKQLLQQFVDLKLEVEYTFTDISPEFLSEKKGEFFRFQGTSVSPEYNLFNIEEDPLGQGFHPEQFDLVVAFNVLHTTRDLQEALTYLKTVLRPGGILIFEEQFHNMNLMSFSFGLLPEWWRAKDFRTSPIINSATWVRILREAGFADVSLIEACEGKMGVVFGRVPEQNTLIQLSLAEKNKMPTWLLFDDNSGICKLLAHKLQVHGRKIILVNPKLNVPDFATISENAGRHVVQLDPQKFVHFESLYEHLHNNSILLEGIIYFSIFTPIQSSSESVKCGLDLNNVVPSGLLHLCQALVTFLESGKMTKPTRLFGITSGVHYIDKGRGPGSPNNSCTWSLLTSFLNENPQFPVTIVDFEEGAEEADFKVTQLMSKLWAKNNEAFTHISGQKEFCLRLKPHSIPRLGLNLEGINHHFEVALPDSKSIQDLEIKTMETTACPGKGEVEVEIKATSLNFRDLFMILRPEGFKFSIENSQGFGVDISGAIRSVGPGTKYVPGDEIIAFQSYGGFKSHLVLPAAEVVRKPRHMSYVDAASIPCAFISAYESLAIIAAVKPTDRVLIHVASGGLGTACIQIAKAVGATIFATAGSRRKRTYLRALGILYVYDSRSTEFGERILNDTQGGGVTVVVNSLTSPGFKETSLRICAQGATFAELGKVDVWSAEEVSFMRPDVKYALIDISEFPREHLMEIWDELMPKFENETYKPLTTTQFPLSRLKEALNYFKGANHIGKVVIKMPELCSVEERDVWKHKMFDEKSTYLITGGLGGLGLKVTQWMLSSGAENVILVGRSQPSPEAYNLIDIWNTAGRNIHIFLVDVSDYAAVANLLKKVNRELPPLRGIFHAAGTLSDTVIAKQTTAKFAETFRPKVIGAWNLHFLTLEYPLEFFVSFSSSASVFAIIGQSNYASANLYLDSLMNYRRASGLPGVTINWGAWGEVGAASKMVLGQEGSHGVSPFTPTQGIAALEYIMENHLNQIIVQEMMDINQIKLVSPLGWNFYDEVKAVVMTEEKEEQKEKHAQLLLAIRSALSPEEAAPLIEIYVETILKETLGMKKEDRIGPNQTWEELGVDSLMTLEIRNRMQTDMLHDGRSISVIALQENRTLKTLCETVGKLFENSGGLVHGLTSDGLDSLRN